jgi:type I restriction enzyme S subunit
MRTASADIEQNNWTRATFGDVVELKQGLCFNKKSNHLMADEGMPILRITDLINGTEAKYVDADKVPVRYVAKTDDIIFTRTGQVGLVFRGRTGVVHNNCFRVIPIKHVSRDYVYWYLKQPAVVEFA